MSPERKYLHEINLPTPQSPLQRALPTSLAVKLPTAWPSSIPVTRSCAQIYRWDSESFVTCAHTITHRDDMPETDIELTHTRFDSRVEAVTAVLSDLDVGSNGRGRTGHAATESILQVLASDTPEDGTPPRTNETELAPVDKGFGAWSFVRFAQTVSPRESNRLLQLVAAFLVESLVWGFPNAYGVFLAQYLDDPVWSSQKNATFLLPMVGPLSSGLMYCTGTYTQLQRRVSTVSSLNLRRAHHVSSRSSLSSAETHIALGWSFADVRQSLWG